MCIYICMLDFDILIKWRKSWYTHTHDYIYICIIIFIYLCCANFCLIFDFLFQFLRFIRSINTHTHMWTFVLMHIITSIFMLRMLCVFFTDILSNFIYFIFKNSIGSQKYIYIMSRDINFGYKYLIFPIRFMGFMEYASFLDSNKHVIASTTTFW
jgi:hypothetical protein